MKTETQSLRTIQLHGPAIPGGKPDESFWTITLGAPYFGMGSKLLQEDRTHPVRTLTLDVVKTSKGDQRWRKARLLSQHVIGGFPTGHYSDNVDLSFHTRIGSAKDIASRDGSVFYTGQTGEPTEKRADFQHVVATPMLLEDDAWPDPEDTEIRIPPCRLVQGAIPLFAVWGGIPWLGSGNPLGLEPFTFDQKKYVRLLLSPDGIVLDAKVPFPTLDGTTASIAGRFLLVPTDDRGLELRLLPAQLTTTQRDTWLEAWAELAPRGDASTERIPGFKVELRPGGLPPAFTWRLSVNGNAIADFEEDIRVPGEDVLVRMLGPAGAEAREGGARLQPDAWVLSRAGSAGALEAAALRDASRTIWNKQTPDEQQKLDEQADWGSLSTTVETWTGAPTLTALLLPTRPARPKENSAPDTALRIDVSKDSLTAKLLGRGGKEAAHSMAHDETQLAIALRSVHGLPTHPPGQCDPERPLLAGFVPLSDGWLQVPIPNLPLPDPEKDSDLIAPPVPAPPNVLAGFLRYGEVEKLPDVLSAFPPTVNDPTPKLELTRAPWLVTVEGTQAIAVAIALGGENGPTKAAAVLLGPELSTRGLLWLSADRPNELEALPRLGAGAGAYLDVPLESFDTEKQQALPVTLRRLQFVVERRPDGAPDIVTRQELGLDLRFNPSSKEWVQRVQEKSPGKLWKKVLTESWQILTGEEQRPDLGPQAEAALPLVLWLRHPAMPLAALMPMTRSVSSAVRPLESRDLIPLVIDAPAQADGGTPLALSWALGGSSVFPTVGAGNAPKVRCAAAWPWPVDDISGIALAAFGVPGAELRAPSSDTALQLPELWAALNFALRFDLPSLDEAFATASLPPVAEVKTPDSTDLPPPSIPLATAIDWRAMRELWTHQSRRHQLARVRHSHLDGYTAMGAATPRTVRDLVGGAKWEVALGFQPGKETDPLPYGEAAIGTEKVAGNAALLGISGEVEVEWEIPLGASTAKPQLVGYAVPTIADGQFLVDARGTGMGEIADGAVWRRKVFARFREKDQDGELVARKSEFELVTCRRELPVFPVAGKAELLRFWFKDLPVGKKAGDDFAPEDHLDPDAWGDGHLPRSGVEWRLWATDAKTAEAVFERGRDRLPFFGFGLEPLRLRKCVVNADDTPGPVVIRCRLHLGPQQSGPEAGANLVELSLKWEGQGYVIAGFAPLQDGDKPVKIFFPLLCREKGTDLTRRVEIATVPAWKDGAPTFSETEITVGMLGEDLHFKGAELAPAATSDGPVTVTKSGRTFGPLTPGLGQMGIEEIAVKTSTETVKGVDFPEIDITRWLTVLPAMDKAGGNAALPAFHVRAVSGQPLEFFAFEVHLEVVEAELREEHGAVSFTGKGAQPIEPFPGYGKTGVFSVGLIARVSNFDSDTGIGQLTAGYLSGRWIEAKPSRSPDCILLEAACQQRVGTEKPTDFWSGALTLHLRFDVTNAIRWPRLTSADAPVPFPQKELHGRETLTFSQTPGSGFAHSVAYALDGHRLAFAVASRLAQATDTETIFSLPAMATHTLAPEHGDGKAFTFTAVETIAFGRAEALIPKPADGEPPAIGTDKRTFAKDPLAFAARYRDILIKGSDAAEIHSPGMVTPGQGRISTVLSGALGHTFRAAYWDLMRDPKPTNSLALIGGFAGFIGDTQDLAAPDPAALLIRLPVLAVLGEQLVIGQKEQTAEVAWADGSASLPVALAWRAAATPASPTLSALRTALLAGADAGFAEADVESAILVEQSFRVNMDRPKKSGLAETLFFPASAVAVARLMPPLGTPPAEPAVLSLVAGLAVREVQGHRKNAPFAAALLTRVAPPPPVALEAAVSQKNALGPERARALLATLGEQVVVGEWTGPASAGETSTPVATARAFAEHAEPRAALLVEIEEDGRAHYLRAILPATTARARFRKPPGQVAFADPQRGFGLAPGEKNAGWLRGVEEGHVAPFRDADSANTEPVEKSGLAGLSRRLSLPAQAIEKQTKTPVWTAEAHAPVYHALANLAGAVAPPISWLAPGQPRPRLPAGPALTAALRDLFGTDLPAVQWVLPAAATAASVGDRAGIALARTLRLEMSFPIFPQFDYLFSRFGRPAQGGSWSVRTERTPRPGPLPENHDDPAFNRRPCASRLEPRLPVEVLRGPSDTISGEANREGKFGAWVVKFLAAPDWDGMISDRFDGTVPVDVEIDIVPGSEVKKGSSAAAMLLRLLMPAAGGGVLRNAASLVVGDKVIACQRVHFVSKVGPVNVGHDFDEHPTVAGVLRGTLRIVLDSRNDQDQPVGGALLKDLAETLRAGFAAPPVELRLTVLPDSERILVSAPAISQVLTQPAPANPEIPHGDSRPPATLRLPLMPVIRSRGALPLPPNSLLFIDATYDTDLGSAPAMDRQRITSVRPQPGPPPKPLPTDRGDLFATLYADRQRVNRRASLVFMIDLAFERPLSAAAQAEADACRVDGDLVTENSSLPEINKTTGEFELAVAVTTREGVRRELFFGTPGSTVSAAGPPKIKPATVYELPLGLLLETERTPARLAAGDMIELTVSEATVPKADGNQTVPRLDVSKRVKPGLWNAATRDAIKLDGLSNAGKTDLERDEVFSRTVRILLTDEPVVEPPPALYAALVYRTIKDDQDTHQLSLPLYAQSPLPWRVTLRDAKADFRRGFVRRTAVFIWNLARPAAELPDTGVHIVKADRNGQTYLPPKELPPGKKIADYFPTTRRISPSQSNSD